MKQVREIAYIAQDCIKSYTLDQTLLLGGTGWWSRILYAINVPGTCRKQHKLANQLRELKERVREVGERRLRYGIAVPDANRKAEQAEKDSKAEEKEEFLRALELEAAAAEDAAPPSFGTAISLLPGGLPSEAGEK